MKYRNEIEIDVFRCLRAIRTRIIFVIFMSIMFFVFGLGYTFNIGEDYYTSRATVYAASSGSYSQSSTAVTAMNAYVTIASSRKVCERASLLIGRDDVSADRVMQSIYVSTAVDNKSSNVNSFMNSSATIITFSATTTEPELSVQMADAMARAYVIEMENIIGDDSIKMLDSAYKYDKSINAAFKAWKFRILSFVAGALVGIAIVVFFEIFDKRVRTIREASLRGSLPVIGVIPNNKK